MTDEKINEIYELSNQCRLYKKYLAEIKRERKDYSMSDHLPIELHFKDYKTETDRIVIGARYNVYFQILKAVETVFSDNMEKAKQKLQEITAEHISLS